MKIWASIVDLKPSPAPVIPSHPLAAGVDLSRITLGLLEHLLRTVKCGVLLVLEDQLHRRLQLVVQSVQRLHVTMSTTKAIHAGPPCSTCGDTLIDGRSLRHPRVTVVSPFPIGPCTSKQSHGTPQSKIEKCNTYQVVDLVSHHLNLTQETQIVPTSRV